MVWFRNKVGRKPLQNPCKMGIKPLQGYADYYDFGEGYTDITKPGRCYSVCRVVYSLLL